MIRWQDIEPKDAVSIDLTKRLDITAPLNENMERCPWPWDPQQLVGAAMGQYHCGYCGAMCMAGMEHVDYTPRCNDPSCRDFGDVNFGEGTCPAEHADFQEGDAR